MKGNGDGMPKKTKTVEELQAENEELRRQNEELRQKNLKLTIQIEYAKKLDALVSERKKRESKK